MPETPPGTMNGQGRARPLPGQRYRSTPLFSMRPSGASERIFAGTLVGTHRNRKIFDPMQSNLGTRSFEIAFPAEGQVLTFATPPKQLPRALPANLVDAPEDGEVLVRHPRARVQGGQLPQASPPAEGCTGFGTRAIFVVTLRFHPLCGLDVGCGRRDRRDPAGIDQ